MPIQYGGDYGWLATSGGLPGGGTNYADDGGLAAMTWAQRSPSSLSPEEVAAYNAWVQSTGKYGTLGSDIQTPQSFDQMVINAGGTPDTKQSQYYAAVTAAGGPGRAPTPGYDPLSNILNAAPTSPAAPTVPTPQSSAPATPMAKVAQNVARATKGTYVPPSSNYASPTGGAQLGVPQPGFGSRGSNFTSTRYKSPWLAYGGWGRR